MAGANGWAAGILSERGKGVPVEEMHKEKRSWKELCVGERGPLEQTWELCCKGRWGLSIEVRRLI